MPKQRIAIFAYFMQGGGLERVLLNLMQGFVDRGYAVDLLLSIGEGPFMELIPDSVRVFYVGTPRIRSSFTPIIQYLRQERPHVLYCAESDRGFEGVVAGLLSFTRIPVMIGMHTIEASERPERMGDRDKRYLQIKRLICPLASKVIPVSHGLIEEIEEDFRIPKRKMHVIYNPVVTEQLKQDMQEPVEHPWLQEKSVPVVLAVGRLSHVKGFDVLIKAFKHVISQAEARLIILGEAAFYESDEREKHESLVRELGLEDYVDLPGFADNPYAYMKNVDLFVSSSRYEGFGNVIVEAMACGCPVVSTDCPTGPTEILQNGEYGTLVPVDDPEALGQAIVEALKSEHDIGKLERRAADFSEDKIINEYLELFQLT